MKQVLYLSFVALFWMLSCAPGSSQQEEPATLPAGDANDAGLVLPDGFDAVLVADNVGKGRHLAIRDNGDIYMQLLQAKDGHSTVALRDTDGDGKADDIRYFNNQPGTGLELYKGYLYTSSDSSVQRYKLIDKQLLPAGQGEQIAGGFPVQRQHAAKPFAFDHQGHMYVTVGAPSNACMERNRTKGSPGMDPCPQLERQGGIWQFDAETPGQTQVQDAHHYATGIRHAVAINWNPAVNKLYVVQHGRDQFSQFFPEMFDAQANADLPAEEFFLVEDGDDFGWPYCYYNQLTEKKMLAPEYGGDREKTGRCADKKDPILGFPGHYAPNDLLFYTQKQFPERYHNGAFIAFHGSWNRAPKEQEGFNIVFVPFQGDMPSGDWEVFADGFAQTQPIQSPADAKYRPTGVALGPDGSLYVSDSRRGAIWRIFYAGE